MVRIFVTKKVQIIIIIEKKEKNLKKSDKNNRSSRLCLEDLTRTAAAVLRSSRFLFDLHILFDLHMAFCLRGEQ